MNPLANAGWFAGSMPTDLGVHDGRLKACPDKPNCVNSQASGSAWIEALAFRDGPESAWQRLAEVIAEMPRMRVVVRTDGYMRLEAQSRIMGFVDDVEFLLDVDSSVIHVRSASRLGYSDLGVNRRRVDDIRRRFERNVEATR